MFKPSYFRTYLLSQHQQLYQLLLLFCYFKPLLYGDIPHSISRADRTADFVFQLYIRKEIIFINKQSMGESLLCVPPWVQRQCAISLASLFAELLRTGAMIYFWAPGIIHRWMLQITIISFLSPELKPVTPNETYNFFKPCTRIVEQAQENSISIWLEGDKKKIYLLHTFDLQCVTYSRNNHRICLMKAMTAKWNIDLCYLRAIFHSYIQ